MVDLLVDLQLAKAASENRIKNIYLEKNIDYLYLVYEKHQIDSARFKRSNYFYTTRIDEYEEIYKEVEGRLKFLKADMNQEP